MRGSDTLAPYFNQFVKNKRSFASMRAQNGVSSGCWRGCLQPGFGKEAFCA
jgi:hypothetical protein